MKIIKTVYKLNFSLYLFILLSFLCGYFKPVLIIFLIVITHECGHIFFIKLFHYPIVKVEIYAFGGITTVEKPINSSLNKEMIISLGGFLFQILLYILMTFFYRQNFLSASFYETFKLYNKTILLFNLLPIIPLDGSVFCHALLEKFFSYFSSFKIYKFISIFSFFLFLILNYVCHFNNYFMCLLLISQYIILLKNEKYYFQKFYLERYLHNYPYRKIENNYTLEKEKLKKETHHYFYHQNRFIDEKELLADYYKKKRMY